jgi:hypothetical protein
MIALFAGAESLVHVYTGPAPPIIMTPSRICQSVSAVTVCTVELVCPSQASGWCFSLVWTWSSFSLRTGNVCYSWQRISVQYKSQEEYNQTFTVTSGCAFNVCLSWPWSDCVLQALPTSCTCPLCCIQHQLEQMHQNLNSTVTYHSIPRYRLHCAQKCMCNLKFKPVSKASFIWHSMVNSLLK